MGIRSRCRGAGLRMGHSGFGIRSTDEAARSLMPCFSRAPDCVASLNGSACCLYSRGPSAWDKVSVRIAAAAKIDLGALVGREDANRVCAASIARFNANGRAMLLCKEELTLAVKIDSPLFRVSDLLDYQRSHALIGRA